MPSTIVGVPREIKREEHRVALAPSATYHLIRDGHRVLVESGAGLDSNYQDQEYSEAGADIVDSHEEVFQRADLIIKVKEPQPEEIPLLRAEHILFTYLHLAANRSLTEALLASGCTAIAYETVSLHGRLPLLEPMSEIAGRMSVFVGAYHLARHQGGRGVLLGGVPGVLPGKVLVIGGGAAGLNAARIATGIGADVTILEVDSERMRFLDTTLHTAHTLYSSETSLLEQLPRVDLIIGAVLVPGARAPRLITRRMLELMQPGSVLVDIAVDQGGCAETTRPTTHDHPTYLEEEVIHYCVANMPSAFSRTASQALTNATHRYVEALASLSLAEACGRYPELIDGVNCIAGELTCRAVAEAHGIPWTQYTPSDWPAGPGCGPL
ncbi:MAG TPA: alanine dehydrogenase [Verrucomicrobiales bacterium]|nr:alanine dehydrogenase [Verrucomicrobiales bacterium]